MERYIYACGFERQKMEILVCMTGNPDGGSGFSEGRVMPSENADQVDGCGEKNIEISGERSKGVL